MFKNVSGYRSGKTFVHGQDCEHLGTYEQFNDCKQNCGNFHAAESMRSGIISMLRKGLTTLGLVGEWDAERAVGNPAASNLVKQYQLMIREEQAKAGITQKSAAILMREDIVKLLQRMSAWLMNPNLTVDERYEMMRDMAFIAVVFATGKRCDDLANLLVSQMVRFPNGRGIMFGFQFGKTLRDGTRQMFGLQPDDVTPEICAVRLMDDFDEFTRKAGIETRGNRLFTKIKRKENPREYTNRLFDGATTKILEESRHRSKPRKVGGVHSLLASRRASF